VSSRSNDGRTPFVRPQPSFVAFRSSALGRAAMMAGNRCYLTFTCGFLPRSLGVLVAIAGACYLTNSAAVVLSPRLASMLFPSILVPAFIGELSFAVWLAVKGVDLAKWQEKAGGSTASL
jgi:hypothetical protein